MKPLARLITLSIASLFLVTGCSKTGTDSSSSTDKRFLADPLLTKLPASTAGFGILDMSGEGYALLKKSPYGGNKDANAAFEELTEKLQAAPNGDELVQIARKLFVAAKKIGFVGEDGSYSPERVVSKGIVFATPKDGEELPIELGTFLSSAHGVDALEKTALVRSSLKESGVVTADENIPGSTAFSISLGATKTKIFVAANKSTFGASTSKAALEGLFSSSSSTALSELQALPEYKRATTNIGASANPLGFAFVSLNRFAPTLERIARREGNQDFKAQELPLEGFALQSSFPKEYLHLVGLAITPRTEPQKKIFQALESSALSPQATKLPSDTAFAVALDARVLSRVESVIQALADSAGEAMANQIKSLETVTIGLRNNTAGSPVPDIFLSVDSTDRDKLNTSVQESLGLAASMAGQSASWQTKEISGNQTRYFTTLIGAGVYLSSPKGQKNLLIGTSEGIIRDLSTSQSASTGGIGEKLSPTLTSQISKANLGLLYFNFPRVAELLNSVKNTLAMFTGGNSELNELLDSAKISSWGTAVGAVSYAPGALSISASMDSSSVQTTSPARSN